jgi:hypothetical protein
MAASSEFLFLLSSLGVNMAAYESVPEDRRQQESTSTATGMVQTAADAQDAVKETAQQTLNTATEAVQDLVKQTTQRADDVIGDATTQLGETVSDVKEQAASAFTAQRDRAIATLTGLAGALRETSGQLGRSANAGAEMPESIAPMVREVADRLEHSASFLQNKDVGTLLNEVRGLAQRQPMAFIGTMFVVGLAGARLLKAPEESTTGGQSPQSSSKAATGSQAAPGTTPGAERFESSYGYPVVGYDTDEQTATGGVS